MTDHLPEGICDGCLEDLQLGTANLTLHRIASNHASERDHRTAMVNNWGWVCEQCDTDYRVMLDEVDERDVTVYSGKRS